MGTYSSWIYTWEVWSVCAVVVVIVPCAVCHRRRCHILPHVSLCRASSSCRAPCTVVVVTPWHSPSASRRCRRGVMHHACCCCRDAVVLAIRVTSPSPFLPAVVVVVVPCAMHRCRNAVVLAIRVTSPSPFSPAVVVVVVVVTPWHSPSVSRRRHRRAVHRAPSSSSS